MDINVQDLQEKWNDILDHEGLPKIRDSYRRQVTSVLLENQAKSNKEAIRKDPTMSLTNLLTEAAPTNSMGASSSVASTGNVDIYDPVLISLVRRSMPNLMAFDVCGVQPMTMPTGLIFALRSRYNGQTGIEALFGEANTWFSAQGSSGSTAQAGLDPSVNVSSNTTYTVGKGLSTAALEALGDSGSNNIREMALSIEKISVVAEGRALKANYSNELAQDLRAVHGLDAETELANILSAEVLADMNRQVIRSIYTTATIGAQTNVTNAGFFDLDVDANGRWMVEKFKGLMFQVEREANQISKDTRAGKGNFIITSSDVASALSMAGVLDYSSALKADALEVDDTGNTFAGVLFGRYKVFIDPYFQSAAGNQFVTVGYKGTSPFDAGLFYCPYVPLQMFKAVDPLSFQPTIAFKTRYGMVSHPFATNIADGRIHVNSKNKYYRIFAISNLM